MDGSTMREPLEAMATYGVIAEVSSVLSRNGISIELISAGPDLHFIVSEENAEQAYKVLKCLIKKAKQHLESQEKK